MQAAISALHVEAPSWEETDWAQIAALYDLLYAVQPSSVVRINQAVAVSYSQDARAGLAMLDGIELINGLETYQPFYSAKADLLRRNGDCDGAVLQLERAIELTENEAEISFLRSKLAVLNSK